MPWFDPESGGVGAAVLVLLQDPSRVAAHGSRLISRHNNDPTAGNTHRVFTGAGLLTSMTVHWNVVPWWVADPDIPAEQRLSLAGAARRARPHLHSLLDLLAALQVVVLLGREAQRAWDASGTSLPGVPVVRAPHPSPLAFNAIDKGTGRVNRELLREAVDRAGAAVL